MNPSLSKIFFSDCFEIDETVLDNYGGFNVSMINDLPLFIDPFLLYDSENDKYKPLHDSIIRYMCFLRDRADYEGLSDADLKELLHFKEIKQNWLGFSKTGNKGNGLGEHFARNFAKSLTTIFKNVGKEKISSASHIEKICLFGEGVGKDHLSDFTTNLIKGFLLEYTQTFAKNHINENQRKVYKVPRAVFDYDKELWLPRTYELPVWGNDYVLLSPFDMLTRDESWISPSDMYFNFNQIVAAIDDSSLRLRVNQHFEKQMRFIDDPQNKDIHAAKENTIRKFPEIIDYFIREKENDPEGAHEQSNVKVNETRQQFEYNSKKLVELVSLVDPNRGRRTTFEECLERIQYLKDVIENQDGYRLLVTSSGKLPTEADFQLLFKLVWVGTKSDVNAEVNNGRGPVDFKVSIGKEDATLVEFKLAKNSQLRKNLEHQTAIYQKASNAKQAIKVIFHFSETEEERVLRILDELKLTGDKSIILIDANPHNKPSASKATSH